MLTGQTTNRLIDHSQGELERAQLRESLKAARAEVEAAEAAAGAAGAASAAALEAKEGELAAVREELDRTTVALQVQGVCVLGYLSEVVVFIGAAMAQDELQQTATYSCRLRVMGW
jgi:multidrug resistance efflux pump